MKKLIILLTVGLIVVGNSAVAAQRTTYHPLTYSRCPTCHVDPCGCNITSPCLPPPPCGSAPCPPPCRPCDPCAPCAPVCGTNCAVTICSIGAAVLAIVGAAALILATGESQQGH